MPASKKVELSKSGLLHRIGSDFKGLKGPPKTGFPRGVVSWLPVGT